MSAVQLKWTDPATDTQGQPLPAGTSVNVFQAPSTTPIGNVALGVQVFTTGELAPGTYQFTTETVDAAGNSVMSNSASAVIAVALPNPPTNLVAAVVA